MDALEAALIPCQLMSQSKQRTSCRRTSSKSCSLVGNKLVDNDNSDVVGAAPTRRRCSNYIFILDLTLASMDWAQTTARRDKKHLSFVIRHDLY